MKMSAKKNADEKKITDEKNDAGAKKDGDPKKELGLKGAQPSPLRKQNNVHV